MVSQPWLPEGRVGAARTLQFVGNCAWCTGRFRVESKTFRLNRKLQHLRAGRIQQVSLQGCGVYFLASCGECPLWVGWAGLTKKFRNWGLWPVAGGVFLEAATWRIGAPCGRTEPLLRLLRASAARGVRAGQLRRAVGASRTAPGFTAGTVAREPAAPRPFAPPNFDSVLHGGWQWGSGKKPR